MNRILSLFFLSLSVVLGIHAQNRIFSPNIRTLQVVRDNDPLQPPVLKLGSGQTLTFTWDEMSHDYHRYIYHLQHCTWDWQPSDELFESDWLYGTNDQPVEDYRNSFNTTQLYTHYTLTLPNRNSSMQLSGNYRLTILEDDDEDGIGEPVLESRFMIWEDKTLTTITASSNTDVDYNRTHQQVTLVCNTSGIDVVDPGRQIHSVVMQNRLPSRTAEGVQPNIRSAKTLEWNHRSEYIFPAGNEFYKFEIIDVNQAGLNIDNMRWYEPFYHATLWQNKKEYSYLSAEDQDGAFIPRTTTDKDYDTQCEYVVMHFSLLSPRLEQDVYVNGQWSNGQFDPTCLMQYNELTGCYEAAVLLKQGFYNYQYITADGSTIDTMGDFWQTENEYQAFIYYREQGGAYDKIVGYTCVHTGI